jgi:hypothetical protein
LVGASCPWGELSAESVPVACEAVSVAGGAVLVNGKAVPVAVACEAFYFMKMVELFSVAGEAVSAVGEIGHV